MQLNIAALTEKSEPVNGAAVSRFVSPATVVVAVPSSKVREALVAMIGALDGFEVVGEAASDEEMIRLAQQFRPVLAIVDVDLPTGGGLWAVERLATEQLADSIIAIGMRGDQRTGIRARLAGAQSYLQTGASVEDLVQTLAAALMPGSRTRSRDKFPERESMYAPLYQV